MPFGRLPVGLDLWISREPTTVMKDRLKELFQTYDLAIQAIISEVLAIEQEKISMERPRVSDEIDRLISLVAKKELERAGKLEAER